jgi:hypothetical protein
LPFCTVTIVVLLPRGHRHSVLDASSVLRRGQLTIATLKSASGMPLHTSRSLALRDGCAASDRPMKPRGGAIARPLCADGR